MTSEYIFQNHYICNQTDAYLYTENFLFSEKDSMDMHGHEFLEIGITMKGQALHTSHTKSLSLQPGSVYMIPIGTHHRVSHFQNWGVRNLYLLPTLFSAHFLHADILSYYKLLNFLLKYGSNACEVTAFSLRDNTFDAIASIFHALDLVSFDQKNTLEAYRTHMLLNILLLLAEDFYSQTADVTFHPNHRLFQIVHFIQEHLDLPLKQLLEDLSCEFSLNSQSINRIIKKELNLPVSRYIIQCKIEKGIQLLSAGKTPTDTAYSLGFYDYSHFQRCFTDYVGLSPSAFLRR